MLLRTMNKEKIKESLRKLVSRKLSSNINSFELLFILLIVAQYDINFRQNLLDRIESDILSDTQFNSEHYIREILKEYV